MMGTMASGWAQDGRRSIAAPPEANARQMHAPVVAPGRWLPTVTQTGTIVGPAGAMADRSISY
jgi:hypothetical protein